MDDKMLSDQITLIADTLAHIDTALSIVVIFLIIAVAVGAFFFFTWLLTHLGGDDE